MDRGKCCKKVDISDEDKVLFNLCHYYSIPPEKIKTYDIGFLSRMYTTMEHNKTIERIKRMEEISVPYMSEKNKDKFLDNLFKDIGENYKKERMIEEDELRRIFGG